MIEQTSTQSMSGALVVSQSAIGQNVGSGQEGMSKSSRLLVRQGATSQATTLQVRVGTRFWRRISLDTTQGSDIVIMDRATERGLLYCNGENSPV